MQMAQGLKIWREQVVVVFPQAPFRVTNVPGPTPVSSTLRSLLNMLARLIPKLGVKRASLFNRDLRATAQLHHGFLRSCR